MTKRRSSILAAVLVAMLVIVGCTSTDEQDNEMDTMKVITSFYPLYYFAEQIGGDHVEVTNLVASGVEPHDWTPKPRDMIRLTEAQVFVYNGLGFEGWVDSFLKGVDDQAAQVIVEASQGIVPIVGGEHSNEHNGEHGHEDLNEEGQSSHEAHTDDDQSREAEHDGHHHGIYDPHVWLSPLQAIKMAENIKEGLVLADPTHIADYEAGFAALKQQLEQLHDEYTAALDATNRRDIVVSHQAYAYLARDYGLTQVPVMGLSPESEPTARDMQRIVEYVRDNNIKYILFEELASPQLAKVLADEAGIETLVFHPVEGLTEEQQQAGEDYMSMMRKNLETLVIALN